ncbi:hypothetical protein ACRAWF_38365 [Streptomyces sp. L7]
MYFYAARPGGRRRGRRAQVGKLPSEDDLPTDRDAFTAADRLHRPRRHLPGLRSLASGKSSVAACGLLLGRPAPRTPDLRSQHRYRRGQAL